MSAATGSPADRRSWTCSRCRVAATFRADITAPERPTGWSEDADGWRCLECRRQEVVETAASEEGASASAHRRLRLTEFELLRDPAAPDHIIARRVHCATAKVPPVRAATLESGQLPPAAPG